VTGYPAQTVLHDPASRQRRAAKILAILRQALGEDLAASRALDIGCASGLITRYLAPHLRWIIGLEYDPQAVARADTAGQPHLLFVRGDAAHLPLADGAADVVICAQVYEHVADPEAMVAEIARVLRPGGVCFFSGPNRWALMEEHYRLPLLSWLPRPWADRYVRLAGRGDAYRERPQSYWALRRLWRGFEWQDYTLDMIRRPEAYHCAPELGRLAWISRLPAGFLRALRPLYPNYNWILRKGVAE